VENKKMTEKRPKVKVTRTKFLKIRVTPEEQEKIRLMAIDRGVSVSKFITLAMEEYAVNKR